MKIEREEINHGANYQSINHGANHQSINHGVNGEITSFDSSSRNENKKAEEGIMSNQMADASLEDVQRSHVR